MLLSQIYFHIYSHFYQCLSEFTIFILLNICQFPPPFRRGSFNLLIRSKYFQLDYAFSILRILFKPLYEFFKVSILRNGLHHYILIDTCHYTMFKFISLYQSLLLVTLIIILIYSNIILNTRLISQYNILYFVQKIIF